MKTCIKCKKTKSGHEFREGKNTCKRCEVEYSNDYYKGNREKQKTLYIPPSVADTWEDIEKAARAENRGIGSFICQKWREWVK